MSDKVIEAKDFAFWYGDFKALTNIDLDVYKNEILALIGPSGCGKSTFLKSINRMNDFVKGTKTEGTKTEGQILFNGKDVYKDMNTIMLRKRVGMVFQQPNPFPQSIYDNVAYGPRINGIKDKKTLDAIVENALRGVGIWDEVKDRLKDNAVGLSGGQQQRICIARTIATEPDIILMDEPTSALDPIASSTIEDLVIELKKKYTIVIVTHNMQQAMRISDRTAFFYLGQLIEVGSTEQIFSMPQQQRTKEYIGGVFS